MKHNLKQRISKLRSDFEEVTGDSFDHFYCPLLFKDENVPLCRAHVINQVFPGSDRAWTIQRSDVDSFFGTNFEADFTAVKDIQGSADPERYFTNPNPRLRSRLFAGEQEVEYFIAEDTVPDQFSLMEVRDTTKPVMLGLKMPPDAVAAQPRDGWRWEVSLDVRLCATVSLIKAAHLTMFHILGYRYALSAAGRYVGHDVLGEFFENNKEQPRSAIRINAERHFTNFIHMVRPFKPESVGWRGTVSDGVVLTCWGSSGRPWAYVVYVRTGGRFDGVLIPTFESPESVDTFLGFLGNERESITVRPTRYHNRRWELYKNSNVVQWQKNDVSFS